MTTVLGLDPSLSATGLAVWRTGQPLHLETIREEAWDTVPADWRMPHRCDRISARVLKWLEPGATVAVIEAPIKPAAEHTKGMATLDIAQLRGVLEVDLMRAGVPFTRIHPATLKAYAVKGNANKAAMVAMARAFLGSLYPVRNDNEADAFWLLAMAMHRYGHPVVPTTPNRVRSVSRVDTWAGWKLES